MMALTIPLHLKGHLEDTNTIDDVETGDPSCLGFLCLLQTVALMSDRSSLSTTCLQCHPDLTIQMNSRCFR